MEILAVITSPGAKSAISLPSMSVTAGVNVLKSIAVFPLFIIAVWGKYTGACLGLLLWTFIYALFLQLSINVFGVPSTSLE